MSVIFLTTAEMATALKNCYEDDIAWKEKVSRMNSRQIYAIFNKLKGEGLINVDGYGNITFRTREEVDELKRRRQMVHDNECHQITLDEFFGDIIDQQK